MMPIPVAIGSIVLAGWPTLKLACALASKPLWRKARPLYERILSDPNLTELEKAAVKQDFSEAYGTPLMLLLPVAAATVLPLSAFIMRTDDVRRSNKLSDVLQRGTERTVEADIEHLPPSERPMAATRILFKNRDYRKLSEITFMIALLRYPVTAIVTFIVMFFTIWFPLFAFGFHLTRHSVQQMLRAWLSSLRTSSVSTIRAMQP